MRNPLCESLGIEYPIFAFTHCRDVAVEVCKAGGLGVLGGARKTPEQFDIELSQMDKALNGRPYGIDLLNPVEHVKSGKGATGGAEEWGHIADLEARIPKEYFDFRDELCRRFDVHIPEDWANRPVFEEGAVATVERSSVLADVAFSHPVKFFMSALGPPSPEVMRRAHGAGALVGGMVGTAHHAEKHKAAGADVVAAIGTEAAGHTGGTSTFVLVPQVVDAVAPMPVLAGGGIGDGRRLAAAFCLGAVGAWTGSVWLATKEHDLDPLLKQRLIDSSSRDAVMTSWMSGKSARFLNTPWFEAWKSSGMDPLEMPLMALLQRPVMVGAWEQRKKEIMSTGVGQIVGDIKSIRSTRDVAISMVTELFDTVQSVCSMLEAE